MAIDIYSRTTVSETTEEIKEKWKGTVTNVQAARITRELNGEFTLELTALADANNMRLLKPGMCLKSQISPSDPVFSTTTPWTFLIDDVIATIDQRLHVTASHLSIRVLRMPVFPFTKPTGEYNINKYLSHNINNGGACAVAHGLTFTAPTMSTSERFVISSPRTVREVIYGKEGSLADKYNTHYNIVNTADTRISIQTDAATGITRTTPICYGVNMTGFSREHDYDNSPFGRLPYWQNQDGDEVVTVTSVVWPTGYVTSNYHLPRIDIQDASSLYENKPTASQLQSAASGMVRSPAEYIKVQVGAYPEAARIGDSIPVIFEAYNIQETMIVTKTVYDILQDRLVGIELGDIKRTLPATLSEIARKTGMII